MSDADTEYKLAVLNNLYYFFPLGILIPLSLGRYAIRLQARGRIYPDDVAHFVAAAFSVVFNILGHNDSSVAGRLTTSVSDIVVLNLLFYGGLWAVKACFLFLYRDVFWISTSFRRIWYATVGVTIVFGLVTIGLQLSVAGMDERQITSYMGVMAYATAPPLLGTYFDFSTSLIIMVIPLWIFSFLHLRRSINLGIAAVYVVGLAGFSMAITGAVSVGDSELVSAVLGTWGIWLEVTAAAMVGYAPLLIPSQRRKVWPWSKRPEKVVDQEEQEEQGKKRWPWSKRKADGVSDGPLSASASHPDPGMNPERKRHNTMTSFVSLIPHSSRSSSETIEMRHFGTSMELDAAKVLPYSHLSIRGEDMES